MADPIVHITNGIPDSGTGNITTLGQTLLDGVNVTYGATTDLAVAAGAAGSISAKLRSISRDIVGGIVLQPGANVIGAVTQSGGPWSVSGTIAATQSGAWNITNITGTVSLPTGAATSANQPTNAALASTTAGQTGNLDLGAVTTAAPVYANGTTNALSLTTVGNLRVDGSSVTQPVSGTVAISGTVAVTESGTWTVQPGNTANTVPWLMTINQGGHAATVSAAGALAVDGSAVTQPVSAASLPLPSGAATAANQPTNAAQGSTTSGQTGTLVQGAVATAAPAYTNGQTSPISLTPAGAIRVDASATTLSVSGTITANQGGTWNQRLQDGSGNAITSDARGTARPLAVEILDASGNQIVSFGAGSGPSFGSAFPATGQAIGVKDSTGVNMTFLKANASNALVVDGSAVTQPVSGTFWQATQPVSGTFWQATQPVSAASLPLPSGASTSANQPSNAAIGSTTSGQTGGLAMGAVTTGLPSYTTAQTDPLSLTPSGLLRVDGSNVTQPISGTVSISGTLAVTQSGAWNITNISGTISLPTGAATSANQPTNASLGSTTSGSTGTLAIGAVTTAAPGYTTGQNNALSLTTAGALRVDGSAVTQPISGSVTASQGGTWTVQPGNTANTTPWLMTIQQGGNAASVTAASALKVDGSAVTQPVSGTITANQGGNWTSRIVGNAGGIVDFAGQNAAQPANSILVGAEFNTTPTTLSSGNASPLQIDNAGNLKVNVVAGGAAGGGTSSSFGSAFPASGTAIGAEYLSSPPTLTSGNMAALQLTSAGSLHITLDNAIPTGSNFIGNMFPYAAVSTAAPSYTTGTNNLLSLNVNGGLRVDGSGVTQPVSGTVTANIGTSGSLALESGGNLASIKTDVDNLNLAQASTTSGQKGNLVLAAATTAAPSYTTAQSNPLSMNLAGGLRVDGSGVTQPVSGTFWQATQPVSGTFWQATQPVSIAAAVTVAQATAANLNATVTGTVNAAQSGTWNVRITGNAGASIDAAQNAAAPANEMVVGGVYNSSAPVLTSGNASQLQLDSSGNLNVNIKAGAGSGGTASSFGSAFPATGTAMGAEYLSSPPSLTSGNMAALQLTSAGSLHTTIDNTSVVVSQGVASNLQTTAYIGGVQSNLQIGAATWSSATPANTAMAMGGGTSAAYTSITGQLTVGTTITAGVITFEESYDGGTTWVTMAAGRLINPTTNAQITNPYTLVASTNLQFEVVTTGTTYIRGRLSTAITGTGTVGWNITSTQLPSQQQVFQSNAAALNATVAQTGTWLMNPLNSVSWGIMSSTQNQAPIANCVFMGAQYNLSPASITSGNTSPLQLDSVGNLRVTINASNASLAVTQSGAWNVGQTGTWTVQPGNTANTVPWLVNSNIKGNAGGILDVANNATAPANVIAVGAVYNSGGYTANNTALSQLQMDSVGSLQVNVKTSVLPTGAATSANQPTNAAAASTTSGQTGHLAMAAVTTAVPSYTTAQTNPLSMTPSGGLRVDGSAVTQPVSGTVTSRIQGSLGTILDAAQNAAAPANALSVGATYNSSGLTTGLTNTAQSALQCDKQGKLLAVGAIRTTKGVQKTSISVATETTVVTAGSAGVFNDVYAIVCTNKSATSVFVDFKDSTGGTTRMTLSVPAGDTRGFTVPVDSAMVQATAANNWTATVSSAVTSIEITMLYVQTI